MWATDEVQLTGSDGRRIHNRYYSHREPSDRLCVMIAGFGYTLESPYLYYSKEPPFERGFDVLGIDFDYSRDRRFRAMTKERQDSAFEADVKGVGAYILQNTGQRDVLFIGKSLGTTATFTLLQNQEIKGRTIGTVWLTPATERFGIFELVKHASFPSFVITGSRDEVAKDIDFGVLSDLSHVAHYSVQGGDHSLETEDRASTFRALQGYLGMLDAFLDRL